MVEPENHTERLHSPFGPSAMERILNCPASVREQHGWPDRPTSYAQHGTAAHMFCELVMSDPGRINPRDYEGGVVDLKAGVITKESTANPAPDDLYVFEIEDQMIDAAGIYRDTILNYVEPGDELELELRLDLSHVKDGAFGTSDAVIYKPRTKHLIVGDFKFGRGHAVEVDDNPQLLTYVVGALHRLHNREVARITLVVVQPRAFHPKGPVRAYEVDTLDADMFEWRLQQGALAADDPNATYKAGDWCFFCKNMNCATLEQAVIEALSVDYADWKTKGEAALPNVTKMTADQLGKAIRNAGIINGFYRRLEKFAHAEAVEGNVPTGCKLVDKLARRSWTNASDAEDYLREKGVDDSDIFADPKMKSPAQIETALGKKVAKALDLDQFISKKSSGTMLTIEEDARPSAAPSNGDEFGSPDL